eukprot:scaffold196799_cov30-Tisochrysis_lutea.AAC.1
MGKACEALARWAYTIGMGEPCNLSGGAFSSTQSLGGYCVCCLLQIPRGLCRRTRSVRCSAFPMLTDDHSCPCGPPVWVIDGASELLISAFHISIRSPRANC